MTPGPESFSGTVREILETKDFLYLRVGTGSGDRWAVVRPTKIKSGDNVVILVSMTADRFPAKSLNRTFEKISIGEIQGGTPLAAAGMAKAGPPSNVKTAPAAAPGAISVDELKAMAAQHMSAGAAPVATKVEKATAADAQTIEEIWSGIATLENTPVTLRGTVVKSTSGVMGRNWLHLRDGSGLAEKGTNDITVTTSDTAAVGEIVTIHGVIRRNRDFGAGYVYAGIVEDARVSK